MIVKQLLWACFTSKVRHTLADEIGVTKGTVSVWERGVRKPDFTKIEKLAVYFNVTISYLLGESEYRNPQEIAEEDAAIWATEDDDEHLTTMGQSSMRSWVCRVGESLMQQFLPHIKMICRMEHSTLQMNIWSESIRPGY